jgi:DNA-binding NarL/FixJ family response regulator
MPSVSLIVEEKPICASAISQYLRRDCGVDEVRIVSSLAGENIGELPGRFVVVVVDLATINYDFVAVEALAARLDLSPVIAIDDRPNPAFSRIAERSNCRGYIAKTFLRDQLTQAIRSVISGQTWFHFEEAEKEDRPGKRPGRALPVLTVRQGAVLACIARGYSNEEIASELGVSVGTVKTHVHAVLRRIGARNRTEAAIIAPRFKIHSRVDRLVDRDEHS